MNRTLPVVALAAWFALMTEGAGDAPAARGGPSARAAGSPGPPPPWADVGPEPKKFEREGASGGREELWAKDGRLHGLCRGWNKDGVLVLEEEYDRGVCRRGKRWDDGGGWQFYGEWDERGQVIYQVVFDEGGRLRTEVGRATADTPPDVPQPPDPITPEIRARADAYVVDKVGRDYFERKYRFARGRSEYYAENTGRGRFFLRYVYAPLRELGGEEAVTVETYDGDNPTTSGHVATVRDGRVVEPTVTQARAVGTAAGRFPHAPRERIAPMLITPSWFWGEKVTTFTWAVYVTEVDRPDDDHGKTTTLFIDAETGQELGTKEREWAR